MNQRTYLPSITRRSFLRAAGLVAGTAAVTALPPLARTAHAGSAPDALIRIGLLLPQSTVHPAMGTDLAAGLKLGLQQARAEAGGGRATLAVQDTGIGVGAVAEKARRLIERDEVDLLVGVAGPAAMDQLRPVLQQSGVSFVLCDAGANELHPEEQAAQVIHNSLGYWQANWAMGHWAAANLGRKAFVASSFYESGYDSLRAFEAGFEAAGGRVVRTRVTHVPPAPHDWAPLFHDIRQAKPDFVFAAYSGALATEFVSAYAAAGLAARIPLAGSAFLVDEGLLAAQGDAALGITSCFSWAGGLDSAENQAFVAGYRTMTGRPPDAFAVLGYDTARLISRRLEAGAVVSPRGALRLAPGTAQVESPLYLREVRMGPAGPVNAVVAELPAVMAAHLRLKAGPRTGWLNAYLSV